MKFISLRNGLFLIISMILLNTAFAGTEIALSKSVVHNDQLPFESHRSNKPFENVLAMNVQYAPVKSVREALSTYLNFPLKFFTGWQPEGEAHITVITPPEYDNVLKRYISMERIEEIARNAAIQRSVIDIIGIGSGEAVIDGKKEQTYFLIVTSDDLIKIREQIYDEYVKNGGPVNAWDPKHFYPHITIGYTLRDLHEADGVIKDAYHSLDTRFELTIVD